VATSISRRIVINLTVATIAVCLCEYGWLYMKARSTAATLRELSLVEQAKIIAGYLVLNREGGLELVLPPRLADVYQNAQSGYRYAIRDENNDIIFTSGPSVGPLPPLSTPGYAIYDYDPDGPGPLRMFGAAVKTMISNRTLVTQVEQTGLESEFLISSATEEFLTDGEWLLLPFLFVLLSVGVLAVRRALKPIERISRMAEAIDPAKSGVRLPTTNVPDEIKPLVTAMNVALDRFDEGLRRQREFNANAAHQLRTPLAVLTANIDAMADTTTAAKLRHDVDLMSRIVSQLLLVAHLETLSITSDEQIDLNVVATDIATNLAPLAIASGKRLEVIHDRSPMLVSGSAQALAAAVSNLVENAIAHTPPKTTITVRVTDDPGIQVIDTGHGVPAEWRDQIFDRFWKGDRQGSGAGLGLAIVKRIMSALHGSVSVSEAPGGGAAFTLIFPRQTLV
jgi:signal transduction histidine kinase